MSGIRDRNLRCGDLAEELGILLLKSVALVAPVPRTEDVGNDALVTLLRPGGSRRLLPDLSFFVQLKSASVKSIRYETPDATAWLRNLDVPLFVGRVSRDKARIDLYSTMRLQWVLLEPPYDVVELLFGSDGETIKDRVLRTANLGKPVLSWSITDASDPDFAAKAFEVLRPHVHCLRLNLELRKIQTIKTLSWETGSPPVENGFGSLFSPAHHCIPSALETIAPYLNRLLSLPSPFLQEEDYAAIDTIRNLMIRIGFDPDPRRLHMIGALMSAEHARRYGRENWGSMTEPKEEPHL